MDLRDFTQSKGTVSPKIPTINGESPELTPEQAARQLTKMPEPELDTMDYNTTVDDPVIKQYLEFLKKHEIKTQDILQVLDILIREGDVVWEFKLFDKLPAAFHLRPAWVNSLLVDKINELGEMNVSKFTDTVSTYNLAGSLFKYGDYQSSLTSKDNFSKALQYVESLPFVIQNALTIKLAVFDRCVAVATSDWATKLFTNSQSDV